MIYSQKVCLVFAILFLFATVYTAFTEQGYMRIALAALQAGLMIIALNGAFL